MNMKNSGLYHNKQESLDQSVKVSSLVMLQDKYI